MQNDCSLDFRNVCDSIGVPLRGTWVSTRDGKAPVVIGGLIRGNLHLIVEERVFQNYTPDEREALVAIEAAWTRWWVRVYRGTTPFLALSLYLGAIAIAGYEIAPGWLQSEGLQLELGFVLVLMLTSAVGRHLVYKADEVAAKVTDAATVANVLERVADEHQSGWLDRIPIRAWVALEPPPQKRIDKLRERTDRERK